MNRCVGNVIVSFKCAYTRTDLPIKQNWWESTEGKPRFQIHSFLLHPATTLAQALIISDLDFQIVRIVFILLHVTPRVIIFENID